MPHRIRSLCLVAGLVLVDWTRLPAIEVIRVAEEAIDTVKSPENGASPLWCFGSSIFVRDGEHLFLSLLRPDEGHLPYCNAHWELWRRDELGWSEVFRGGGALEREPCPLGLLGEGELLLSIQPKFVPKPYQDGDGDVPWFCQPGLLGIRPFETEHEDAVFENLHPVFPVGSVFSQHSYRGLGVDRENREILLLVIEQTGEHYQPTWLDRDRVWRPLPLVKFPVRACYPQVAIVDRAAHILAIGDIVEPIEAWRQAKFEVLHRKWDYVFRRLFYTWSPDLETESFRAPVEVDSVEETGGYMRNLDLYIDTGGRAHVLYLKMPHQYAFIRDRWFPGEIMNVSLEYVVLEDGEVIRRTTLRTGLAEAPLPVSRENMRLDSGRFHSLPGGGLSVVYSGSWSDHDGEVQSGLFLSRLTGDGAFGETVGLPSGQPLTGIFFTNTPRSGSDVGNHLDLIGAFSVGGSYEMRYLGYEICE